MPNCIFHHPHAVAPGGSSGDTVRPFQMLAAFRDLGFEVECVVGRGRQRAESMLRVRRAMQAGVRYDFFYAESPVWPMLATEPHRLPTYPDLDFRFMSHLKRERIPIGVFYRDIRWKFHARRDLSLGRLAGRLFHEYDLLRYRSLVDVMFLPSSGMAQYLTGDWNRVPVVSLPPGVPSVHTASDSGHAKRPDARRRSGVVRLLYVGGVTPPDYDMSLLFSLIRSVDEVELTLCCRRSEWEHARAEYNVPSNVRVVHVSGAELAPYYFEADAFVIAWPPRSYLTFAMPVKLFEAMGYGLPVIATEGLAVSEFVKKNDIGIVVANRAAFVEAIRAIAADRKEDKGMRDRVRLAAERNSWRERAKRVAGALASQGVASDVSP